ncbi:MAG: DUF4416 family protein [Bacteriovoracaceae bacterium]|nr:DUF4416 family protein [Bacteriovoracaceae bacterium]
MSELKKPKSTLIFASFLYRKDKLSIEEIQHLWEETWGPSLFFIHPYVPMKDYYSKEMGAVDLLQRFFLVSHRLMPKDILKEAKHWSIAQEKKHTELESRLLNLDVGIISLENIQLATGKSFTHRVYLGEGIYSDLTLIYEKDTFQTLPWTYPDYSHPEIIDFFNWCRKSLHIQLKNIF